MLEEPGAGRAARSGQEQPKARQEQPGQGRHSQEQPRAGHMGCVEEGVVPRPPSPKTLLLKLGVGGLGSPAESPCSINRILIEDRVRPAMGDFA